MKRPPFLQEGDTVAILSTGNPLMPGSVAPARRIIERWGLKTVLGKTIGKKSGSFAGVDKTRLEDFQNMLDDDSIAAVLHAHGGDGAVRIVDQVDFTKFRKKPKWISGYSDVTFFHSHIHGNFRTETIHSTMPIDILTQGVLKSSWESLRKAFFGEKLSCSMRSHKLNRTGEATGIVVGGNLSILSGLQGTNSDIDTAGKILFLECVGEHYFRIDSFMMGLKKSGKLENLRGLLVGRFTDVQPDHPPFGQTVEEIIMHAAKDYDFPVAFRYPAGHEKKHCALILGREATLVVEKKGSHLEFAE